MEHPEPAARTTVKSAVMENYIENLLTNRNEELKVYAPWYTTDRATKESWKHFSFPVFSSCCRANHHSPFLFSSTFMLGFQFSVVAVKCWTQMKDKENKREEDRNQADEEREPARESQHPLRTSNSSKQHLTSKETRWDKEREWSGHFTEQESHV